jgi:hypothetical protein
MPSGWSRRTATSARSTPARRISTLISGLPQSATPCPGSRVRYRGHTRRHNRAAGSRDGQFTLGQVIGAAA